MAIIKCPECGHQISDRAPVCPSCGVEIAGKITRCPQCGEIYFNDSDVCPNCNHANLSAHETRGTTNTPAPNTVPPAIPVTATQEPGDAGKEQPAPK